MGSFLIAWYGTRGSRPTPSILTVFPAPFISIGISIDSLQHNSRAKHKGLKCMSFRVKVGPEV